VETGSVETIAEAVGGGGFVLDSFKRRMRMAVVCCLLLVPVAAVVVGATTDRSLAWYWWILATIVADLVLCMFLGLVCMVFGYVVFVFDRELGKGLIGFGASLGVIVFSVGRLWSIVGSRDKQ